MNLSAGELLFCLAAIALGSALGTLRAAYLIRQADLGDELATVLALPNRKGQS